MNIVKNLGNDLVLDDTGDLQIADNGDFLTSDDLEAKMNPEDVPFAGFVCLRETIYNVLLSEKRDWVFDINTGANIPYYLSKPMNDKFNEIKESISSELRKDDRIESVESIELLRFPEQSMVTIQIRVKAIGISEISTYVFPYSLL